MRHDGKPERLRRLRPDATGWRAMSWPLPDGSKESGLYRSRKTVRVCAPLKNRRRAIEVGLSGHQSVHFIGVELTSS